MRYLIIILFLASCSKAETCYVCTTSTNSIGTGISTFKREYCDITAEEAKAKEKQSKQHGIETFTKCDAVIK